MNFTLNQEQLEAVTAPLMPVCVLANAGSGKTRVLTNRIAYLVNEVHADPNEILAMTFTKKAANEMQERVSKMVHTSPKISTIHSLCYSILSRDIAKCKYVRRGFEVVDDKYISFIMSFSKNEIARSMNYFEWGEFFAYMREQKELKHLPDQADDSEPRYKELYRTIQTELISKNKITYDDIILYAAFLLEDADVREHWQNQYHYVLVDEYQDTSPLQAEIINALVERSQNIYVVGDNDQSIYGFRGADMQIILDFGKTFPNAKTYKLETNYRSDKNIVAAANAVIKNNTLRFDKKLVPNSEDKGKVEVLDFDDIDKEALFVATRAKELNDYDNTAVLIRNNAQAGALEIAFKDQNIPYQLVGGYPFYKREEILDILAYLELSQDWNNEKAFARIANKPNRYVGKETVKKIILYCKNNNAVLLDALVNDISSIASIMKLNNSQKNNLRNLAFDIMHIPSDLKKAIGYVRASIKYDSYLSKAADAQVIADKLGNLDMLEERANIFADDEINDIKHFVSRCYSMQNAKEEKHGVNIITIHKAKGLEFKHVIVIGICEKILPSKHAKELKDIEEERRLFYVAITRAEHDLCLTYFKKLRIDDEDKTMQPSRFLDEIPKKLLAKAKKTIKRKTEQYTIDKSIIEKLF